MITTSEDKTLGPERYDSRLFNQVYRANIKAKQLKEDKDKKRKNILIYSSVSLIVTLITIFFIFKPKPPKQYVQLGDMDNLSYVQHKDIVLPDVNQSRVLGALDMELSAKSAIVYDLNSHRDILSKNTDERLNIASLTKLVTSMVMIDTYGLDYSLEITKEVPEDIEYTLGLQKGDVISTDQLLKAMLISSYNDAAYVLANEYGYDAFIELMNQKVKDLGCENTNFVNPMGYDSKNHYSTVQDLKRIVSAVLNYPSILETTQLTGNSISWISNDEMVEDYIYTTNRLVLENLYVNGLKTGYTEDSGECLITLYESEDMRFIVILLDSEDRFGETEDIIDALSY